MENLEEKNSIILVKNLKIACKRHCLIHLYSSPFYCREREREREEKLTKKAKTHLLLVDQKHEVSIILYAILGLTIVLEIKICILFTCMLRTLVL